MTPAFNEILREAVFGTLSDRRGLLGYGVPTATLLAALTIDMLGMFGATVGAMVGATYGATIALIIISFYWQRRYLLRPEFDPVRIKLLGSYFWRAALFFGILYNIPYILVFTLSFSFSPEDYWHNGDIVVDHFVDHASDQNPLLLNFVLYSLIILSGRLLLVFPSIAVGRPISWRESWKLAGNRGFHLGIVIALLHTPSLAFEYLALFAFQDGTAWIVTYNVVSSFLEVLTTLMALVASAFLYKSTAHTITST